CTTSPSYEDGHGYDSTFFDYW
nr:immunoglobulin heavy chain junction region [Macaca mulatta]MOV52850.1 immunoglobulin heavy chain junction region [Macaca mulatta]